MLLIFFFSNFRISIFGWESKSARRILSSMVFIWIFAWIEYWIWNAMPKLDVRRIGWWKLELTFYLFYEWSMELSTCCNLIFGENPMSLAKSYWGRIYCLLYMFNGWYVIQLRNLVVVEVGRVWLELPSPIHSCKPNTSSIRKPSSTRIIIPSTADLYIYIYIY